MCLIQVNVQKTPSCTQKQHTEAAHRSSAHLSYSDIIERRLFCKSKREDVVLKDMKTRSLRFVHLVSLDLELADMVARINDDEKHFLQV